MPSARTRVLSCQSRRPISMESNIYGYNFGAGVLLPSVPPIRPFEFKVVWWVACDNWGCKQGHDMYFSRSIATILPPRPCMQSRVHLLPTNCAGAEGQYCHWYQSIARNSLTVADMCSTIPDWLWFGLSLFIVLWAVSSSTNLSLRSISRTGWTIILRRRKYSRQAVFYISLWRCT